MNTKEDVHKFMNFVNNNHLNEQDRKQICLEYGLFIVECKDS